jgi:hypothetical protein
MTAMVQLLKQSPFEDSLNAEGEVFVRVDDFGWTILNEFEVNALVCEKAHDVSDQPFSVSRFKEVFRRTLELRLSLNLFPNERAVG